MDLLSKKEKENKMSICPKVMQHNELLRLKEYTPICNRVIFLTWCYAIYIYICQFNAGAIWYSP